MHNAHPKFLLGQVYTVSVHTSEEKNSWAAPSFYH
jgi:hypothetical protein